MKKLTLYFSVLVFLPLYPIVQAQGSSVDVTVTISGPKTVKPGAFATYAITVSNRGLLGASVHTLNVFASELTFISSASDSRCSVASDFSPPRIGCNFGFIGVSESTTAKITFKVSDASVCNSSFAQEATAFTAETDKNNSNNYDRIITDIVCGNLTPISISSITFSSDYDTVTAMLSSVPDSSKDPRFNYAFYKNGTVVSGGTSPLSQSKNVTITGFRRHVENNEVNGRYDVGFAVCPGGHDIPSPLCGPVHRMSFTDDQINESSKSKIVCGFVPEGEDVLQCEEMIGASCQRLRGTGYPNVKTCRSKVSEGYCCIPDEPSYNQCFERISKADCERRGGTYSEFRNTGTCATCYEGEQKAVEPKVTCYSPLSGGGGQCEQVDASTCPSDNSFSSNEDCWKYHERGQNPQPPSSLPPAGYEDEVLVNIDAYNNPFPDTSLTTVEGRAAAELYRRAVIGGFPDGEFKGSRNVNRAEAAKFLLLARYGSVADISNSGQFPDVLDGQWYTKFVVTAANKGIINGYPDGTFRPADTVNTAEFLKMLSLTFGLQLNLQYQYVDVSPQDWFAPYTGVAKAYDLFPKRSMYLNPGNPLTREEVAVAIYQYLQNR